MKKNVNFFSFWLLFALLGTATTVFNSCSKDDSGSNSIGGTSTSDPGVVINGVKWATRNVDKPGAFAAKPEDAGMFYQWNRKAAWATTSDVTGWDSTISNGDTWEKANDPSPAGWRVPTNDEIQKLLDTDKVKDDWTTQNGINGRKFTDIATGKTLFLPAVGYRHNDGTLDFAGWYGEYWSSAASANVKVYYLQFDYNGATQYNGQVRNNGICVRSVAE